MLNDLLACPRCDKTPLEEADGPDESDGGSEYRAEEGGERVVRLDEFRRRTR